MVIKKVFRTAYLLRVTPGCIVVNYHPEPIPSISHPNLMESNGQIARLIHDHQHDTNVMSSIQLRNVDSI